MSATRSTASMPRSISAEAPIRSATSNAIGRSDWRTFRADRIQPRLTTGANFTPRDPPARDLAGENPAWYSPPLLAKLRKSVRSSHQPMISRTVS